MPLLMLFVLSIDFKEYSKNPGDNSSGFFLFTTLMIKKLGIIQI